MIAWQFGSRYVMNNVHSTSHEIIYKQRRPWTPRPQPASRGEDSSSGLGSGLHSYWKDVRDGELNSIQMMLVASLETVFDG